MPKKYCPSCGFGTDYTVTKPSKCANPKCYKIYESIAAAPVYNPPPEVPTRVVVRQPVIIQDDDPNPEEGDFYFDPNADLGSMRISASSKPRKVTVGDLANTGKSEEPVRDIPSRINKTSVLNTLLPNRNVKSKNAVAAKRRVAKTRK